MTQQQEQKPALVEWLALTIDCPDPNVLADFFATALGGKVTHRATDVAFAQAAGLSLNFRAVPDHKPPTWPSPEIPLHSHFELVVEDPDTAAQEMLRLGARMAQHQNPDNPHLVVMLDPAGHPFCLIRSSAARRY
jgi:hypothetical protein